MKGILINFFDMKMFYNLHYQQNITIYIYWLIPWIYCIVNATEGLDLPFYLILMNMNSNSHLWLLATVMDNAGLDLYLQVCLYCWGGGQQTVISELLSANWFRVKEGCCWEVPQFPALRMDAFQKGKLCSFSQEQSKINLPYHIVSGHYRGLKEG